MAKTPPNSHCSHLQTLAYGGKVRPLDYNLQLLEQLSGEEQKGLS